MSSETTEDPRRVATAAERMRRSREFRRKGLRLLRIRIAETEIEKLVRKGFLDEGLRHEECAIAAAAEQLIAYALFEKSPQLVTCNNTED